MGTSPHGMRKGKDQEEDLVSWEELDAVMNTVGARARCMLDNTKLPRSEWQTCTDIVIEPVVPEKS